MGALLGWILIGVGILFLLLGFAGAVLKMIKDGRTSAFDAAPGGSAWAEFVKAVTALIGALAAAPMWLALVFVGLILIVLGAQLALPGKFIPV